MQAYLELSCIEFSQNRIINLQFSLEGINFWSQLYERIGVYAVFLVNVDGTSMSCSTFSFEPLIYNFFVMHDLLFSFLSFFFPK